MVTADVSGPSKSEGPSQAKGAKTESRVLGVGKEATVVSEADIYCSDDLRAKRSTTE